MRRALLAAAVAALIVAAYANSLDNAFHFDDAHVVENNVYIRSLQHAPRYFTDASTFSSIPSHGSYRPLVSLTLAIDYALGGGLAPRQFHITQIALLLVFAALLAVFYRRTLLDAAPRLALPAALFATAWFAVHTANTETMNLISARSELLAVGGVVAAFGVYQSFPRLRVTGLHLLPMIVGALAKVHAVMYAPLLFAYVWLWSPPEERPAARLRRTLRQTWPSFLAAGVTYWFIGRMDTPEWTPGGTGRGEYLLTQPFVWLHYARLFFLPVGLTADTDWTVFAAWYDTRAILGFLFIALLVAAFLRTSRRADTKPIAFGLAWFAIALVPTSSIVPFAEVANEHRVFFPYVGLTMAVVWAGCLAGQRVMASWPAGRARVVIAAIAGLLLAAHVAGTVVRNRIWYTEESLWRDVTVKSPANGRGLMNYGLTQMSKGDYQTARNYFEAAKSLTPNYSTLFVNLGIAYGGLRQPETAEANFLRAIELLPDADAHFYYARWLVGQGRGPAAVTHLEQALRDSRGRIDARHLLMSLYAAADNEVDLGPLATDSLSLDPSDPVAGAYARGGSPAGHLATPELALAAGLAALEASRFADAAEDFRRLLQLNPQSADGWNNRGWAQLQLGFVPESIKSLERALSIDPAHVRARNNLALALQRR